MEFGDKTIYGATKNVDEDLRKTIALLNDEVFKLAEKNEIDYLLISLRAIANYTGVLFDRLISYQDLPIEYTAISARNLFECYLIAAYIISNPSKGKEFISQKPREELEINEGFLSLTTKNTSEESIKSIRDRIDYIREIVRVNHLTPSKHWTVSHLARQTNNEQEYKAFFKLYSKYIHPSSWIMNSNRYEYDNPVFKNIFLLQGQHYTSCITKLIDEYLGNKTIA